MKTIRTFLQIDQAQIARSFLEAAGIPAYLPDEHTVALGLQYAPSGIRLQVADADESRARRVLDEQEEFLPLPDDFIPPKAEEASHPVPARKRPTMASAFFLGVVASLFLLLAAAAIARVADVQIFITWSAAVLLLCLGGLCGLIALAIYRRGKRHG